MKKKSAQLGRSALDLIEDAVHLLRTVPARVLLTYYVGAIPFALGLLFFWADMSCGAFAQRRCPASAFGMVILFVWLKCWQSVFTSALRARLAAVPETKWNFSRVLRLIFVQGIVQPSRLFLLPAALITALPFAWVLAFYENVTVLGDGAEAGVRAVFRRSAAQARLWPKQNHLLLALLLLVAAVLWLNALIAVLTAPQLLKMFLGVETAFSRAGLWVIFNTTFLAVTLALAWLALDPLTKAVYTLRCFHGEAQKDGADLLAELSVVRGRSNLLAVAALVFLSLLPLSARAANATNSPPAKVQSSATVPSAQIETAVKQTLQHDKYAWRLPREKAVEDDSPTKAWLRTFFTSIGHTLADWARSVRDWIRSILDWFNKHFMPKPKPSEDGTARHFEWVEVFRWFAYALILFAAAALTLLVVRLWRQGWRRPKIVAAEIVPARPDLNDENVTAAQLPEDEWLKLAGELLNQGDLRLALRVFYLASLAHLASREIVSIARFKSNHDYENEVNRRARGSPELRAAFAANVSSFDRAWYGLYDVTAEALAQFRSNFDRIRSC
jgi:hypothetical protein